MKAKPETVVFLSYAFRPFFALGSAFSIFAIFIWLMILHGQGIRGLTPLWHGHEMLFGFAMAAVAGFSLTAVANWTGRTAIHGARLGWLVAAWLAGRLAMLFIAWLPAVFVLLADSLFPVLLGVLLSKEIIAARSRRNYPLVVIMIIVIALNILYQAGAAGWLPGADRIALYLLIHTLLLLVTIIAGRIIPAFSTNWLRQQGASRLPINDEHVNKLASGLTVILGVAASFAPTHSFTGVLAFITALIHGYRLSRWAGLSTISNPLLFVLHIAYLWLPVGYVLLGCAVFGWLFTPTAALHALTMGAIGIMVLAVTTRVALGHTGRPLVAARATVLAYWVLMIAVVLRVLGPLSGGRYMLMIDLSAAAWMLAFGVFLWVYWPILSRPRAG